ncbi:hypothetical protein EYF80_010625 [Liparis tanakae]|uniref:Uncharacterized protein n=1 Tax=Liparis tanakae TaxID=230148 RepID=A0A4Z2IN28_9TELE|nr:hypothetical protein EYF80_010625 [Liparis tanakae]
MQIELLIHGIRCHNLMKNGLMVAMVCQKDAADLQVGDGWCAVDLHVGGVGRGQLEAISKPKHRGSRRTSRYMCWLSWPMELLAVQRYWPAYVNRTFFKIPFPASPTRLHLSYHGSSGSLRMPYTEQALSVSS